MFAVEATVINFCSFKACKHRKKYLCSNWFIPYHSDFLVIWFHDSPYSHQSQLLLSAPLFAYVFRKPVVQTVLATRAILYITSNYESIRVSLTWLRCLCVW